MSYELGEQVASGTNHKPLKEFIQLKNMKKNDVIEGVHQGRFESKAKPGYFFHVLRKLDGEAYAYGTCQALDDRMNEVLKKQEETGNKLYAKIKYNGRVPSKSNPKMTYYSFSTPELHVATEKQEEASNAPEYEMTSDASFSADEIPF